VGSLFCWMLNGFVPTMAAEPYTRVKDRIG
jgi:hypothetical protein